MTPEEFYAIQALVDNDDVFALDEIKHDLLVINYIQKLRVVRRNEIPLTMEVLVQVAEIIHLDATNEIPEERFMAFFSAGSIFAPAVEGRTHAIHLAAKYGLVNLATSLIAYNPELAHAKGKYSQTPIMWAAARGHNAIVKLLIAQGVDLNAPVLLPESNPEYWSIHNCTPLDGTYLAHHLEVSFTLIRAGAISYIDIGEAARCRGKRSIGPMAASCHTTMFKPVAAESEKTGLPMRPSSALT